MEMYIKLLTTAILLVAITLAARGLAFLITEKSPVKINIKPLNCYGCLSFWLTVLIASVFAVRLRNLFEGDARQVVAFAFAASSVLSGLINYLLIKIKYRVYD